MFFIKMNTKRLIEHVGDGKIVEIEYFRPDGKQNAPYGLPEWVGGTYQAIRKNERSFIRTNPFENVLEEGIVPDDEQYGFGDFRGGVIVFSSDVNAVIDSEGGNSIIRKIKKIYATACNKLFKNRKLNRIVKNKQDEFNDVAGMNMLVGFTIGHNFIGRFISSNGKAYDERSTTIDFGGLDSERLLLIAIDICREFKQESVLVNDYNTNKRFFVNANPLGGSTPEEKLANATKDLANLSRVNKKSI